MYTFYTENGCLPVLSNLSMAGCRFIAFKVEYSTYPLSLQTT